MREQLLASLKPLNACDEDSRGGGDHDLNPDRVPDQNTKAAAVLVPIVARDTGPTVLLTVRTQHLRAHAGQVSFPGGRTDEGDASAIATALREAQEEVGLKSSDVELLGLLDNYQTGTNYLVTPVVAWVAPHIELTLNKNEVAHAFEIPLDFVLNPIHHGIESRSYQGRTRRYYVFRYQEFFVWGATAGMLMNLYRRLQP